MAGIEDPPGPPIDEPPPPTGYPPPGSFPAGPEFGGSPFSVPYGSGAQPYGRKRYRASMLQGGEMAMQDQTDPYGLGMSDLGATADPYGGGYAGIRDRIESLPKTSTPRRGVPSPEDFAAWLQDYGGFDPSGGGGYLDAISRDLNERQANDVSQAGLAADLFAPDDPLAHSYGIIRANQSARDRYGSTMAEARARAAMSREQQFFELMKLYLGGKYAPRDSSQTDWGAIVGDLAGAGLGAYLGGRRK